MLINTALHSASSPRPSGRTGKYLRKRSSSAQKALDPVAACGRRQCVKNCVQQSAFASARRFRGWVGKRPSPRATAKATAANCDPSRAGVRAAASDKAAGAVAAAAAAVGPHLGTTATEDVPGHHLPVSESNGKPSSSPKGHPRSRLAAATSAAEDGLGGRNGRGRSGHWNSNTPRLPKPFLPFHVHVTPCAASKSMKHCTSPEEHPRDKQGKNNLTMSRLTLTLE
mmetsp:Transcript_21860/g.65153  ORF Transcript_21860/g.65153 Transcript_21860/m.65153 type:complete len:226 (-) Transcript_21860:269-946(-)